MKLRADPRSRPHPLALGGAERNAQGFRGLSFTEAGEEPALESARQTLVALAQSAEGAVEIEKPFHLSFDGDAALVERDRLAALSSFRGLRRGLYLRPSGGAIGILSGLARIRKSEDLEVRIVGVVEACFKAALRRRLRALASDARAKGFGRIAKRADSQS